MAASSSADQWQRMIADEFWQAVAAAGIESAPDLAYYLCTEDEAREWAILHGPSSHVDNFI